MFRKITLAAAVAAVLFAANLQAETLDTRIGKLEFTHDFANGYPTDATVKKLFDEMDFQRAVQAYLWAIPFAAVTGLIFLLLNIATDGHWLTNTVTANVNPRF